MVAAYLMPARQVASAGTSIGDGRFAVERALHVTGGRALLWGHSTAIGQTVLIERVAGLSRARLTHALARRDAILALAHPHLARGIDAFVAQGTLWCVQVPGAGTTLAQPRAIVTQAEAVTWGVQLCNALNYLAWQPATHDVVPLLDPFTIFISEAGRVRLTHLSALLGCAIPRYRSRFHLPGERGTAAAIGGIGATLHNALTGWAGRYADGAPPLEALRPDCSPQLSAILARALARDPAERWPDAAALRLALLGLPAASPPAWHH
jgi:hypothetical protein